MTVATPLTIGCVLLYVFVQTKGDIKNKKENKKSTGSSHKQCNPDCSDEKDEEDKDSISSEKEVGAPVL